MPLRIDEVDAQLDIAAPESESAGTRPSEAEAAARSTTREALRPLVLDILEQELERVRRRFG